MGRIINKSVIYHVRGTVMCNTYIDQKELDELVLCLNPTELRLYNLLKFSKLRNPSPEFFSSENLARELDVTVSNLNKSKTGLKQKGYALLVRFKDEKNNPSIRVIVGKDQVLLYNAGVIGEISNSKVFNTLLRRFPITNPDLTTEQRNQLVEQFNEYYEANKQEFK